jgi:K+-sensing histidine kinase KdpD
MTDRHPTAQITRWLTYGGAVIAPVILGACLYPARGHLVAANLALLFVVCTVGIASTGIQCAALVAAVASGLSFDYFCTVPYLTLRMSRSEDAITTLLLVVVGLVVGQLAALGRKARIQARASSDRIRRIHALSERIATGSEPAFLISAVSSELRELLSLQDCRFTDRPSGDVMARIKGDGSVAIGSLLWQPERFGLPTRQVELPVRSGGFPVGSFILTPTPAVPVDLERRIAAIALADELGAALSVRSLAS